VRELLAVRPGRPVLLAESGAVEPGHSGPFKLYTKDRRGIILHDVLFAPFFAGAAGGGQNWHWDHYVAKNDLWWQFGRFAEAVRNVDPPAERFQPASVQHPRLRVYVLKGRKTVLAWGRDVQNTWKTELAEGKAPGTIRGASVDLAKVLAGRKGVSARTYDPWANRWRDATLEGTKVALPDFQRSIVVRIE
jgi:hypothetical protein